MIFKLAHRCFATRSKIKIPSIVLLTSCSIAAFSMHALAQEAPNERSESIFTKFKQLRESFDGDERFTNPQGMRAADVVPMFIPTSEAMAATITRSTNASTGSTTSSTTASLPRISNTAQPPAPTATATTPTVSPPAPAATSTTATQPETTPAPTETTAPAATQPEPTAAAATTATTEAGAAAPTGVTTTPQAETATAEKTPETAQNPASPTPAATTEESQDPPPLNVFEESEAKINLNLPRLQLRNLIVPGEEKKTDPEAIRIIKPNVLDKDGNAEDEASDKSDEDRLLPRKRPKLNYRTEKLPSMIYKKEYEPVNQHLPKAYYVEEYKRILFDSVASGNTEVLRAMIQYFDDTEIRNAEGNTPLLYAVMAQNTPSLYALLYLGANTNVTNNAGVSPLYAALYLGRSDLIELLLKQRANPNMAMANGDTALHYAVKKRDLAMVKALLAHQADVNVLNNRSHSPLMLAAFNGDEAIIDQLLRAGANKHLRNNNGYSASQIAAGRGLLELAKHIEMSQYKVASPRPTPSANIDSGDNESSEGKRDYSTPDPSDKANVQAMRDDLLFQALVKYPTKPEFTPSPNDLAEEMSAPAPAAPVATTAASVQLRAPETETTILPNVIPEETTEPKSESKPVTYTNPVGTPASTEASDAMMDDLMFSEPSESGTPIDAPLPETDIINLPPLDEPTTPAPTQTEEKSVTPTEPTASQDTTERSKLYQHLNNMIEQRTGKPAPKTPTTPTAQPSETKPQEPLSKEEIIDKILDWHEKQ